MTQFVVFSTPRSRSTWLARFLTYGEWICGHDQVQYMRSMEDVKSWLSQPCTGSVETAVGSWWRMLRELAPDTKVVVLRRPVEEVVESLGRLGMVPEKEFCTKAITKLDQKLQQIAKRWPGALEISFEDLSTPDGCRKVWSHCLPYEFDDNWYAAIAACNVQTDMRGVLRYYMANQKQLGDLTKIAKHKSLALLSSCEPVPPDGITFQCESFGSWYNGAQELFAEHLVQVGEPPDGHKQKNLPLLQKLDDMNCLQVMTARSNGRMFGYLMTVIAPALDKNELVAEHTTFFASPTVPGLGLKLQRAAMAKLKARGINTLFMRAGKRGSGPRLGALFRRLGAEELGQMYRAEIGAL